jgi:hypothetical protein
MQLVHAWCHMRHHQRHGKWRQHEA